MKQTNLLSGKERDIRAPYKMKPGKGSSKGGGKARGGRAGSDGGSYSPGDHHTV